MPFKKYYKTNRRYKGFGAYTKAELNARAGARHNKRKRSLASALATMSISNNKPSDADMIRATQEVERLLYKPSDADMIRATEEVENQIFWQQEQDELENMIKSFRRQDKKRKLPYNFAPSQKRKRF